MIPLWQYPNRPLAWRLECAPGADLTADPATYTWIDITTALHASSPITSKVGGVDEQGETTSEFRFKLRNPTGRFTTGKPESDLWPFWDVDCPLRWSIDIGDGTGWHIVCVQNIGSAEDEWPKMTPHQCLASVVAAGTFRRIGQGRLIDQPLRTAILANAPVAYWPLYDGALSGSMGSALAGGAPMTVAGVPKLAQTGGLPGSAGSFPLLIENSAPTGTLRATFTNVSDQTFSIELWVKPEGPDSFFTVGTFYTTSPQWSTWFIRLGASFSFYGNGYGVLLVQGLDWFGPDVDIQIPGKLYDGQWHRLRISLTQSGGSAVLTGQIDDGATQFDTKTGTVGALTSVMLGVDQDAFAAEGTFWIEETPALSVAHLAVYNTDSPAQTYDAGIGFVGEQAHERIERACNEGGIAVSTTATTSEAMGPQPRARRLGVLRESEQTDHGILTDHLGVVGYRALNELYNQEPALVLDGLNRELFGPFQPKRDDLGRRNVVKASRPNGGEATYTHPSALLNEYATREGSVEVNVATDARLIHHAGYAVGLGTVEGKRHPQVTIDLLRAPELAPAVLRLRLGDVIRIDNPPRQATKGSIYLMVRGWTQTWHGRMKWEIVLNTVPAEPYNVGVIEGTGSAGRIASGGGHALDTAVEAAAPGSSSSLSVATLSGPLLTTSAALPGDFPIDANLGGERVSITAISGASSPQTVIATRGVNGVVKRHPVGTTLDAWRPHGIAL